MVERLDEQRTRIADAERMAAWRDVARHLAHEIKNPLLPIRLTVEELRDRFSGQNEDDRKMLEQSTRVIGEEIDHLQRLVREFSEFARMPELHPQPTSLQALAADVSSLYPRVYTTIDDGHAPEPFPFDPDQMRRVLINLYDNVVSVGAERVAVLIERRGENVALHFGDNGPGMTEDVRAKAFDPYFTTRSEGTGLGLAVLRNIVVLHGGTVTVESAPDMGTIFVITLPLAGPPAETNTQAE
jgi:two-component system nitrogen regulation sensor histidine kinase NtrY